MSAGQGRSPAGRFDDGVELGIDVAPGQDVELFVADLSLSRAFYEGVPAARLLARVRLAYDERDVGGAGGSYDALLAELLGGVRPALDRVRKAVARHGRAASDEGALLAPEGAATALVWAVALAPDIDASLAETVGEGSGVVRVSDVNEAGEFMVAVQKGCGALDARLLPEGSASSPRVALFEACVRLAARQAIGPWPRERVTRAHALLYASDLGVSLVRLASQPLLPRSIEIETRRRDRRMARLERTELDALVRRDPRELASAIARLEGDAHDSTRLDSLVADLTRLLSVSGTLVLAVPYPDATREALPSPPPSMRPSWLPTDWSNPDTVAELADALEHGALTPPRLHAVVLRGGDPALDAIGAEMLRVAQHPFASAAFSEVLSRSPRPRDVMRLVTYFAVAPDPALAARALAASTAPDVATVLRAWLEAMLPQDGSLPPVGDDPNTSSTARLRACIAALQPYPALYREVCPLLERLTTPP